MWYLVKSIGGMLSVLAFFYMVFFMDLAGQTFISHLGDIWRSPVVEEKLSLIRHGVRSEIEVRLVDGAQQQQRKTVREALMGPTSDIEEEDRRQLEELIAGQ